MILQIIEDVLSILTGIEGKYLKLKVCNRSLQTHFSCLTMIPCIQVSNYQSSYRDGSMELLWTAASARALRSDPIPPWICPSPTWCAPHDKKKCAEDHVPCCHRTWTCVASAVKRWESCRVIKHVTPFRPGGESSDAV